MLPRESLAVFQSHWRDSVSPDSDAFDSLLSYSWVVVLAIVRRCRIGARAAMNGMHNIQNEKFIVYVIFAVMESIHNDVRSIEEILAEVPVEALLVEVLRQFKKWSSRIDSNQS